MIDILNKYNIGRKKLIGIGIFIILFLIALPLTLIQVQKQQEIRQRAEGLNFVYLELKPLKDGKNAIDTQFVQTLYLQNPLNKDISGVDITLTYNKDHLDVIDFITEDNLSYLVKDTNIPGEVHLVGINSRQTHIIDSSIPLGAFIFKAKKEGNGTIDFSKVTIIATSETQPLIPIYNKPGLYEIAEKSSASIGLSGDINSDKKINQDDVDALINHYGETGGRFDLNKDGIVDGTDYNILIRITPTIAPTPSYSTSPEKTPEAQNIDFLIDIEIVDSFPQHPKVKVTAIDNEKGFHSMGIIVYHGGIDIQTQIPDYHNKPCQNPNYCSFIFDIKPERTESLVIMPIGTRKAGEGFRGLPLQLKKNVPVIVNRRVVEYVDAPFSKGVRLRLDNDLKDVDVFLNRFLLINDRALTYVGRVGEPSNIAFFEISKFVTVDVSAPRPPIPPPSISDIDMDTSLGQVGTKFLVFSRVTSNGSLESIKATVKYDKGSVIHEEIIQLYDDGSHGDDKAGDGYYVNVWDSNKKGLPKEIIIVAKDTDENTSTLSKAFELTEEACREVVAGYNDKNAKRANIVFAGANYGSIEAFSKKVEQALGFNEVEGGLFSQEPFRSNKDKFNFWYSNQIGSIKGCDIKRLPKSLADVAQCRAVISAAAGNCIVDSKYTIGLIGDIVDLKNFAFGTTAYIFTNDFYDRKIDPTYLKLKGLITHEFGHSFGKLSDEYIGESNIIASSKILAKLLGEGVTVEGHNVFKGSREACLSPKNPWYDLIGRGCGADNVTDCIENYNPNKDELTCSPGVDKEACYKEVGCFKGAGSPNNSRSSFSTIMRGSTMVDTKNFSRSYGPVNERELCKKIKKITGSVGGICNEYGL